MGVVADVLVVDDVAADVVAAVCANTGASGENRKATIIRAAIPFRKNMYLVGNNRVPIECQKAQNLQRTQTL